MSDDMDIRATIDRFYADFYEHAPDMYALIDADSGTIDSCNQTFARELGYDVSEVVGSDEEQFFEENSTTALQRIRETLEETDEIDNVEVEMRRADGSTFAGSLSATAFRKDGELVAIHSSIRDISTLKETECELRRRTEQLERSNEQLEQFAYLASHDLQEPLRMVASYTQLLEKRYRDELDDQARQYIDYAVEGAERMKQLINDLLTYSRVGGPDSQFERVDTDALLEDVEANLRMTIGESGATIHWSELPDVEGDYSQLLQLFQNLVENGIKFRDDTPPRIEIASEPAEREGMCQFSVTDNGIGFEPENAERIFQIFQRLHERNEYEGTGTGLAIVKKIVDNHGGEIEVESEPGEGTTFRFTLPFAST